MTELAFSFDALLTLESGLARDAAELPPPAVLRDKRLERDATLSARSCRNDRCGSGATRGRAQDLTVNLRAERLPAFTAVSGLCSKPPDRFVNGPIAPIGTRPSFEIPLRESSPRTVFRAKSRVKPTDLQIFGKSVPAPGAILARFNVFALPLLPRWPLGANDAQSLRYDRSSFEICDRPASARRTKGGSEPLVARGLIFERAQAPVAKSVHNGINDVLALFALDEMPTRGFAFPPQQRFVSSL